MLVIRSLDELRTHIHARMKMFDNQVKRENGCCADTRAEGMWVAMKEALDMVDILIAAESQRLKDALKTRKLNHPKKGKQS